MSWLSFFRVGRGSKSPDSHPADWWHVKGLKDSDSSVGADRLSGDAPLTDEAREEAIERACDVMLAAMNRCEAYKVRFLASGSVADKAEAAIHREQAHRARRSMEALIKGRSAAQIRRMTIARGLV